MCGVRCHPSTHPPLRQNFLQRVSTSKGKGGGVLPSVKKISAFLQKKNTIKILVSYFLPNPRLLKPEPQLVSQLASQKPYPTLPCPALPCPALPCPALPAGLPDCPKKAAEDRLGSNFHTLPVKFNQIVTGVQFPSSTRVKLVYILGRHFFCWGSLQPKCYFKT